jgi:hypothetical protein
MCENFHHRSDVLLFFPVLITADHTGLDGRQAVRTSIPPLHFKTQVVDFDDASRAYYLRVASDLVHQLYVPNFDKSSKVALENEEDRDRAANAATGHHGFRKYPFSAWYFRLFYYRCPFDM